MIPELRYLSYDERLEDCGFTTLETRWLYGDQTVKILNGYENIDSNMFFFFIIKIVELEDMR